MKRIAAVLASLTFAACGDTGVEWAPAEPPPEAIEVLPPHAELQPRQALQLQATFTPGGADTRVTWTTTAPDSALSSTGLFTAGNTSGTYEVRATSFAVPEVFGTASVTITSPISVTIVDPGPVTACTGVQLEATVTGTGATAVTWTALDPSCGGFENLPPYNRFVSSRGSGGCPVRACSTADVGACGELLVNIAPERILAVTVAPAATTLPRGNSVQHAATVQTTCGTFAAGS